MQLINFIHQIATTLGDFFDLENGFLRYEMESFKKGPKIRGAGQRPKQKLFSIRPLLKLQFFAFSKMELKADKC